MEEGVKEIRRKERRRENRWYKAIFEHLSFDRNYRPLFIVSLFIIPPLLSHRLVFITLLPSSCIGVVYRSLENRGGIREKEKGEGGGKLTEDIGVG